MTGQSFTWAFVKWRPVRPETDPPLTCTRCRATSKTIDGWYVAHDEQRYLHLCPHCATTERRG